jgi:signal transduction histidine kinase
VASALFPAEPSWGHRSSARLPFALVIALIVVWIVDGWALGADDAKGGPSAAPAALGLALSLLLVGWSYSSLQVIRRLALCNDFGRLFNPSDSLDASLYAFAGMLRAAHGAESCLVVLDDAHGKSARLYIADGSRPFAARGAALDPQLIRALLALPPEHAVLYERPALARGSPSCRAYQAATMEASSADPEQLGALGNLLDARSFVSLPLRSRGQTLGRVHLVSQRRRYRRREVRFLAQLMSQAGPLIENMQLVEQLALTVATQERKRISRDLHDSTVQPYLGLKLGLEALRRRLPPEAVVAREVDELIAMAGEGISQLRQYVGRLKSDDRLHKRESLVQGVRLHAHRFSELYPIQTSVLAAGEILVSSALYEEIIQIVREGLSNIRRHTPAQRASVELRSGDGRLFIEIANDRGEHAPAAPQFQPRSISERARELGGRVSVGERSNGDTVVSVDIPL